MKDIIRNIIREEGPITFARYMDLALYYPKQGYYTSDRNIIGKDGDFFTSVHVSSIFGEMVGEQIREMFNIVAEETFKIVEFGAGRGYLAYDILSTLMKHPDVFNKITYYIIEIGSGLKEKQQRLIGELNLPPGKVQWIDTLEQIEKPFFGCVVSNELVDAFPVHMVKQVEGRLQEIFVGLNETNEFSEYLQDLSTPLINHYFNRQNIALGDGQRGEVNLTALDWIKEVGNTLDKGFVITVDYGYQAELLHHPCRWDGTVMCYRQHKALANPYENPGDQDITSHVNFSALMLWGSDVGLVTTGFTTQMRFLFNLGIVDKLREDVSKTLAAQKLLQPEGMGGIFKVLIQHKGIHNPKLSGLTNIF